MMGRNRRGNRQASMRARIGIAGAVLIGGGAAGVAVVAANHHAPAATTASEAGFIMQFHHRIGEQAALSSALSMWGSSQHSQMQAMNTLAQMVPMRSFSQVWHRHTEYAAQRGVVVLATRHFLVVKSANGGLHLWWLNTGTMFQNVSASPTGMTAMTGNNTASVQAMVNQNMAPAAAVMAGSTAVVTQMAAPVAKPTTITIDTGTSVITITITSTTATVTQPVTTATTTPTTTMSPTATPTTTVKPTATPGVTTTPVAVTTTTPIVTTTTPVVTATATPSVRATPSATATQPTFTATNGVVRGDLVFIAGVRSHGRLIAKLVLFSAPATMTGTPTPTPTVIVPSVTATPTVTTPTVTGTSTFSGVKS